MCRRKMGKKVPTCPKWSLLKWALQPLRLLTDVTALDQRPVEDWLSKQHAQVAIMCVCSKFDQRPVEDWLSKQHAKVPIMCVCSKF